MKCDYCNYCRKQHTLDCPNSQYCYSLKNKPFFELKEKYKSKITCNDRVFYNIHHFNKLKKILGKIIWKLNIEDV